MKKYNAFWTKNASPLEKLKQEIDLRYNFAKYKRLQEQFILNRIEKNNYNLLYDAIEDLKVKE